MDHTGGRYGGRWWWAGREEIERGRPSTTNANEQFYFTVAKREIEPREYPFVKQRKNRMGVKLIARQKYTHTAENVEKAAATSESAETNHHMYTQAPSSSNGP